MNQTTQNSSGVQLRFALDLRVVVVLLLLVIAALLLIWKPWTARTDADARTITMRGEATLTAKPDEFVFYPTYEFKGADQNAALAELSKKSDEIVRNLKQLGVPENKIKTNSNAYNRGYAPTSEPAEHAYTLTLTVTVADEKLIQKVQDYLVTTTPTGAISPLANFSDSKRKQLESEARTKAVEDAKTKAEQTAKELGVKVGKVKSVSDSTEFIVSPSRATGEMAADNKASLGVHPGENELPYSVSVVFFIR